MPDPEAMEAKHQRRAFRYLSMKESSDCWWLFEHLSLPFSNPQFFNDPFDICPRCDSMAEQEFDYLLRREFAFLPKNDVRTFRQFERDLTPKREEIMLKAQFEYPVSFRESMGKTIAVLCLSQSPDSPNNILQWSHYADSHQGIAVELNLDVMKPWAAQIGGDAQDVVYQSSRPLSHSDSAGDCFFVKSPMWVYESEFRFAAPVSALVKPPKSVKHAAQIKPNFVKAVYLGVETYRVVPERNRLMRLLLSDPWQDIAIYQMLPKASQFEISEKQLDRARIRKHLGF